MLLTEPSLALLPLAILGKRVSGVELGPLHRGFPGYDQQDE